MTWEVELWVEERGKRPGEQSTWKAAASADLGDGWMASVEFVEQDGAPVVGAVRLEPTTDGMIPPGGITVRRLRSIPFAELLQRVRSLVHAEAQNDDTGTVALWTRWLNQEMRPRPGRRGHTDLYYASLSALYEQVSASSASPVAELAKQRNLSRARMRDLLHDARRRGFLTPGIHGRGGGQLTEKGRAVLAEAEANAPATRARRPGARHRGGTHDARKR